MPGAILGSEDTAENPAFTNGHRRGVREIKKNSVCQYCVKSIHCWQVSERKSLGCVWLFATPWTVARQALPSFEFSRQEYWSGRSFPSPGNLPNPGIEPRLHIKAITKESLLNRSGNPAHCSRVTWTGKKSKDKEIICICIADWLLL